MHKVDAWLHARFTKVISYFKIFIIHVFVLVNLKQVDNYYFKVLCFEESTVDHTIIRRLYEVWRIEICI